jgi:hypothetical protein
MCARYIVLTWIVVASAGANATDQISTGNYVTEGGWGSLTISRSTSNAPLSFEISATGANAHFCFGTGEIRGDKGISDECSIQLEQQKNKMLVKMIDGGCGCGMNVQVDGEYFREDSYCAKQKDIRDEFSQQYQAGQYKQAKKTLGQLLSRCDSFMDWHALAEIRNDLAITEFHLGNKAACLNLLEPIKKQFVDDPAQSGYWFRPADEVWGEATTKATRFNWKKCGGVLPKYSPPSH